MYLHEYYHTKLINCFKIFSYPKIKNFSQYSVRCVTKIDGLLSFILETLKKTMRVFFKINFIHSITY